MGSSLWERILTEREVSEVKLAVLYASQFNHGTSGHLAYRVIAKFAKILDYLDVRNVDGSEYDETELKQYLVNLFGEK